MSKSSVWVAHSFADFSREAAGGPSAQWLRILPGNTVRLEPREPPPPVIVARRGTVPAPYPILEGRHRQPLPRVPGYRRGALLEEQGDDIERRNLGDAIDAWLVPWRAGSDRTLVITLHRDTRLVLDVSRWPEPTVTSHTESLDQSDQRPRDRVLRRAARVLDLAPSAFAMAPSTRAAYARLEEIWNDVRLEGVDPLGELLANQAARLKGTLEDLGQRPRAVLRSEHRMLKLQQVRRVDAKSQQWLSAQPGRNVAERAGARQRIKAPKRYDTHATLENGVLRAFAALTVRETKRWLEQCGEGASRRAEIETHQVRARRVESLLREQNVPEARPPVAPNFPLRFDRRYREIWKSWLELRAMNMATELEWMWQGRTFLELLGLRAAMKLHEAAASRTTTGSLCHAAVLRADGAPVQGTYLVEGALRFVLGMGPLEALRSVEFAFGDQDGAVGAVAAVGEGTEVFWDAAEATAPMVAVGELPWTRGHAWDATLSRWAKRIVG